MVVNVVSESEFFPKGHGVHTAYLNCVQMLRAKGVQVKINSLGKADITHIQTVGPLAFFKLTNSKNVVVTAHVTPGSFKGSLTGEKYWGPFSTRYLRYFYNKADLVLAVSPKVVSELKSFGVKSRIEVMENPLNLDVFNKNEVLRTSEREKLNLGKDDFVVLGVGQIQTRKGIADFIEVAEKIPEAKFVWVGGEPFKGVIEKDERLQNLLKNRPANVIFTGTVDYSRMPALYNASDVFFFPSLQETAGMVVVEAAACGLPLILRDLDEFKLLYKTGYAAGKNNEEFVSLIKKLTEDKEYLKKQTEESATIPPHFSFDSLGDKLISYYNSLPRIRTTSSSST